MTLTDRDDSYRMLSRRLARVSPAHGALVSQLVPEFAGQHAGALLRRMRERGLAVRVHDGPPAHWAPSPHLLAAAAAAADARVKARPRLALPAPPSLDHPDRFEPVAGFAHLRRTLERFVGMAWMVSAGGDGSVWTSSHNLYLCDRATSVELERMCDVPRPDEDISVTFQGGSVLYFSRRAWHGAQYDRCLQELNVVHDGQRITVEFLTDGR